MQPCEDGFLLSEVPLGAGMLDLARIVTALRQANPRINLNLEMVTRDPLRIPCLKDGYYATFARSYRDRRLAAAMARAQSSSVKVRVPITAGKTLADILAEEETYNRESLTWMQQHLRASKGATN